MNKLINSHPECVTKTKEKIIVCSEKNRKIAFKNSPGYWVYKIRIDDCVIKEGKKCDFGLIPCDNVEIYVELKGNKLSEAIEQLEITIPQLTSHPKAIKKFCFVVCSKVDVIETKIQICKSQFIRNFNARLNIKCVQDEFNLINCC
ncbi:hypothetical protein [Synechococcus sp. PCC 6312]|uniref:hypothetical protein n=1 Tax=Synechococcus sp. (strain ATCC 27167 / PCC 6312) TaxID=195253 RepID=UPI00029F1003|nr:hypothetical protein [Synechococcus sp. PCC 6312]AFY60808.1 hypothetical protein Syn6312_1649 [Synechococcus sp. PCC 6312]